MYLQGLEISGFGNYANQKLSDLPPSVVVFVGDNEAGKSTLLGFLRGVLFGFPKGNEKAVSYPAPPGCAFGGSVILQLASGHRYRLTRTREGKNSKEGDPVLYPLEGPPTELRHLLGQVTRETFRSVYAFNLADLQDLKALEDEALTQVLYGAAGGIAVKALPGLTKKIDKDVKTYMSGKSGKLPATLAEIRDLEKKIRDRAQTTKAYDEVFKQWKTLDEEIRAIQGVIDCLTDVVSAVGLVSKMSDAYDEAKQAFDACEKPTLAPEPQLVDQLTKGLELFRSQGIELRTLQSQYKAMRVEVAEQQSKLPAWTEQRLCDADFETLKSEVSGFAERLKKAEDGLKDATAQEKQAKEKVEEQEGRMRQDGYSLEPLQVESVSLDDLKERLRVLGQIQDRLLERGDLVNKKRELEVERDQARMEVEKPDTSSGSLLAKGMMVGGGAFGLAGLLVGLPTAQLASQGGGTRMHVLLWLLGAVLALFGLVLHTRATRRTEDERKTAKEKHRTTQQKLDSHDEKINKTDSLNGTDADTLKLAARPTPTVIADEQDDTRVRLKRLEHEGKATEERGRLAGLKRALESARVQAEECAGQAETEWINWRSWLVEHDLSTQLSCDEAKECLNKLEKLRSLQSAAQDFAVEIKRLETSLKGYRERAALANLQVIKDEDLLSKVEDWLVEVGKAAEQAREREELGKEVVRCEKALSDASMARDAAFQKLTNIRQQGTVAGEAGLATDSLEDLKGRLDDLKDRLDGRSPQDPGLIDQRAALKLKLEAFGDPDAIATLALELESHKAKLTEHAAQWTRLALAQHLLDEARKRYEADAQPEVFRDASRWLERVTEGRYVKVHKPLGEDEEVEVLGADGQRKQVGHLSSGTRDLLYLAIRFGFVMHQRQLSEPMPLVFDDILVNFDPTRARRTAECIHELAKGHQVLVFTCHPSTVEHFRAVDPKVPVWRINDGRFERES